MVFGVGVAVQPAAAWAAEPVPAALRGVGVDERLGASIDRQLAFTDHNGRAVKIGDYLGDGKPVLLTLNYYMCPTLCNLQLNALNDGLRALSWAPGDKYRIVTVSIDPREGPELAKGKRGMYLESLGRGEVDWTFLVGTEQNIRALADQVGFRYEYDAKQDQYGHALVLTFLSPEGMVARYLYGMEYSARDLKFALMEASEGRLGSPADKLILSCFHYDATLGAYGPFAMGIMRLGGLLTVLGMAVAGLVLWTKDRARRLKEAHP
jgi:protein SCO1/2